VIVERQRSRTIASKDKTSTLHEQSDQANEKHPAFTMPNVIAAGFLSAQQITFRHLLPPSSTAAVTRHRRTSDVSAEQPFPRYKQKDRRICRVFE
jgi:hypothetical protein